MWTEFDEPLCTISAETTATRERARSKKRRKKSRSRHRSTGAPRAAADNSAPDNLTSDTASGQLTASTVPGGTLPPVLGAFCNEQPEAPQAPILYVASNICAPDSQAAHFRLSRIKHDGTAGVGTFAVPSEDAVITNHDEIDGLPATTSTASVLCAVELQSPKRRARHRAFRSVGLAGMGLVSLISALSLLNPGSHLEAEAPGTIDQAPVSVRVWTDPPPLEQIRSVAEISPIVSQSGQQLVVAPTGLAVVQKVPSEVSPHTGLPPDNRLVEAISVSLVPVPQEAVQSASVPSVPLPPRRPVSLITRRIPATHPVSITAPPSTDAPTEPAVEQSQPPESYASFSARKHEIGTHKLPWGMARLHEDPNSDTGRGAVWDFVPSEP